MRESVTVDSNNGSFTGAIINGVSVWKGIPYAKPPVGSLRFKRSILIDKYDAPVNAFEYAKSSPQKKYDSEKMSEDCLYLNIWARPGTKNAPVILYIHGGSFCAGSGADDSCNGINLAKDHDAVVVTVNYRLGVLGWLDFSANGDYDSNCGLSDIINAIKWTHNNIEAFGGDPENITVMGQSAGAITISALVTMDDVIPYLSKAIMMSSGPTLFVTREEAASLAEKFIEYSGFAPDRLREFSPSEIIEKQIGFTSFCGMGSGTFTIEIDGDMVERFPIPAANKKSIPVLMGNTKEEMSFLFIKPIAKSLEIDGIMQSGVSVESEDLRKRIPVMYREKFGKRGPSMMMADLVFRLASTWFAEVYSKNNDVWMYSFEYETVAMRISNLHSFHSSDLPFIFGDFSAGLAKYMFLFTWFRKKARKMSSVMQADFMKFARTGRLDWEKCCGKNTPAKKYNETVSYGQMIPMEIKDAYKASEYRKRSFEDLYDEFK